MKDLKYLAAFSIPIMAYFGISMRGLWSFMTPVYAFVVIPVLELMISVDDKNLEKQEAENKLKNKLFDWLLYLNLPINRPRKISNVVFTKRKISQNFSIHWVS